MGKHEEPVGSCRCWRSGLRLGLAWLQPADEETHDRNLPEPGSSAGYHRYHLELLLHCLGLIIRTI